MSLAKMNFFSKELNMRTEVTVIMPEYPDQRLTGKNYKEKFLSGYRFPVLYFLNGFTGDYTDCLTMMPVERFVQETGIAMVVPSGLNTWYEDIAGGPHMNSFIAEELPAAMEAMLPLSDTADRRFLGGLSMGGRGAAMISARYPDSYRATICLSAPLYLPGVLTSAVNQDPVLLKQNFETVFCDEEKRIDKRYEYYSVAEALIRSGKMIPEMLYLFGEDDPLYPEQFDKFIAFVKKHDLPVLYEKWQNCRHDFEFWEPAMKRSMTWLASKLILPERKKV